MSHWDAARAKPHYPGCPIARGQTEPCVGPAGRMPSACECGYGDRLYDALLADYIAEAGDFSAAAFYYYDSHPENAEPLEDVEWLRGILAESDRRRG